MSAAVAEIPALALTAAHVVTGPPTMSAGHMLLQLLLGMAVIVGVIVAGTKLARGRHGSAPSSRGLQRRRGLVQVLGRQALGKGVSVAVVQVGERAYLLGVTPSEVRRLGETDACALLASSEPASESASGRARSAAVLRGAIRARLERSDRFSRSAGSTGVVGSAAVAGVEEPRTALRATVSIASFEASSGSARVTPIGGARPAPTWTSTIEHLRERTVRRA